MHIHPGRGYTYYGFFLLRHLLVSGASIPYLVECQYYMAKKANISILDSNNMPDWEREVMIGFLMRDLKKEAEQYNSI